MQHKAVYYYSAGSLYVFGRQPHPSSGVHKTVTTPETHRVTLQNNK